jgi:hypothetical protein
LVAEITVVAAGKESIINFLAEFTVDEAAKESRMIVLLWSTPAQRKRRWMLQEIREVKEEEERIIRFVTTIDQSSDIGFFKNERYIDSIEEGWGKGVKTIVLNCLGSALVCEVALSKKALEQAPSTVASCLGNTKANQQSTMCANGSTKTVKNRRKNQNKPTINHGKPAELSAKIRSTGDGQKGEGNNKSTNNQTREASKMEQKC